jgi:EAL domain-containing protein (putative c-di-GMP-specific phosphodiesterase class I)
VEDALKATGFDPRCLELEITESILVQSVEDTTTTLKRLKGMGPRVSIDDFGTGYSSLTYLKRFPIDTLKLDQMFVRNVASDPSDAAIVTAIITMAHSLNLNVIAEGVESEEQFAFLKSRRCDCVQGYLFGYPFTVEEVDRFLTDRRILSMT